MEKNSNDSINDTLQHIKINLVNIEKRLENIENKLGNNENNIENIKNDINCIKNSAIHMDNHISFIENVYDNVKSPLFYVLEKLSFKKIAVKEPKMIESYNNTVE
jgi:archaellum component FlaC